MNKRSWMFIYQLWCSLKMYIYSLKINNLLAWVFFFYILWNEDSISCLHSQTSSFRSILNQACTLCIKCVHICINKQFLKCWNFCVHAEQCGQKSRVNNGMSTNNTYFVKVGYALIDNLYVSLNGEKNFFCKLAIKYLMIVMSEYFFLHVFECLMTFWIDK